MSNIKILSQNPIVLKDTDSLYQDLYMHLNEGIENKISENFKFTSTTGEIIKEKYRNIYSINDIINENLEIIKLLKFFAKEKVPLFLKKFKNLISDVDYKFNGIENYKYVLRLRLFEDKENYSLAPHKDSNDTIFSFIFQLNEKNPKTKIYHNHASYEITNEVDANIKNTIVQFVKEKITKSTDIKWGEKQFNGREWLWIDEDKCLNYLEENGVIKIEEYIAKKIEYAVNEIIGLHNIRKSPIYSSKYIIYNKNSFHGVSPIKIESRNLLIMDLIGKSSTENLILDGYGFDNSTYFLIYQEESNNHFKSILL